MWAIWYKLGGVTFRLFSRSSGSTWCNVDFFGFLLFRCPFVLPRLRRWFCWLHFFSWFDWSFFYAFLCFCYLLGFDALPDHGIRWRTRLFFTEDYSWRIFRQLCFLWWRRSRFLFGTVQLRVRLHWNNCFSSWRTRLWLSLHVRGNNLSNVISIICYFQARQEGIKILDKNDVVLKTFSYYLVYFVGPRLLHGSLWALNLRFSLLFSVFVA